MKSVWTKIGKNFLALVLGLSLAFAILEGALRIYNPFAIRVKGQKIVLPTNKKYTYQNERIEKLDKTIIHTKNSLGFRGSDPPKDFQNYLTIIAIGGSTTECVYLSEGKSWVDLLGKKLGSEFRDVWINNAGLDVHSTFGHIVLLQDYVVRLKPKLALFLVGANDMYIDRINRFDELQMKKLQLASWNDLLLSLRNVSEVVNLSFNLYGSLNLRERGLAHNNLDLSKVEPNHVPTSQAEALKTIVKTNFLNQYRNRVTKIVEISRMNSIEPVLITQPALFGNAVDDITGVNLGEIRVNTTNGSIEWEILELYNDVLRDIGLQMGVPVIDLARELPKSSLYYYDFYHFDNEGAEKVADLTYKDLLRLLSEKYGQYLTENGKR